MNKRLIIYGAGGHGRVVADAALKTGYTVTGYIDANKPAGTAIYQDIRVLVNTIDGEELKKLGDCFIVAMGNNESRSKVYTALSEYLAPALVIHPAAVIEPTATIGEGTVVLANGV